MTLLFLIMAQAADPAAIDSTASVVPPRCGAERPLNGEIVVCGNRGERTSPYRINQPPAPQEGLPKAQMQIADGVSASAETEQQILGGWPSNRFMVRLKIKF